MTPVPTNESNEKIKKYDELWSKIKDLIRSITKHSDGYHEKYMKIKFNLDDALPPNKTTKISSMIIVVRAIFLENQKYYPQVFFGWISTWIIKMLYYDRTDVSEWIIVNKTGK